MRAVVFDLDGTLVDSVAAIADVGNSLMLELGLAALSVEEARGYIGNGAAKFVERALAARAINADAATLAHHVERFEEIYGAAPGSANPPFAGAELALKTLKAEGVRIGLCTNKPGIPTANLLAALGWSDLFEVVIAGDSLATRKPDPAPLVEAARRLGIEVSAPGFAYVGDSEVDAETAERAGSRFALFTLGYRKQPVEALTHTIAFDDLAALPALLADLAAR